MGGRVNGLRRIPAFFRYAMVKAYVKSLYQVHDEEHLSSRSYRLMWAFN